MFKKYLIRIALSVIDNLFLKVISTAAEKAKLTGLVAYVQRLLKPLAEVIEAITDKDPDDAAQLAEIWEKYDEPILDDTLLTAANIVRNKVKGEAGELIASYLEELAKDNILDTELEKEEI